MIKVLSAKVTALKSFAELKTYLEEAKAVSGTYKRMKYRISNLGSMYTLYVDDEKIDVYPSQKEAEKAAKEFIDLNR